MAGGSQAGSGDQGRAGRGVDDGTLARILSPLPGPIGAIAGVALGAVWDEIAQVRDALEAVVTAAPTLDGAQLRSAIVQTAQNQFQRWHKPKLLHERDPVARAMLEVYWRVGVDWHVTDKQLADADWQDAHPWSAAFICYVLRAAGAGDQFQYAANHAAYIRWAIENQVQKTKSIFKGLPITEAVPVPGDILGKSRSGSGATYDSIQKPGYVATHCDIVTEVRGNKLVTIGGNVADTVSETLVNVDKDGHVKDANYIVVIKVLDLAWPPSGKVNIPGPVPMPYPNVATSGKEPSGKVNIGNSTVTNSK